MRKHASCSRISLVAAVINLIVLLLNVSCALTFDLGLDEPNIPVKSSLFLYSIVRTHTRTGSYASPVSPAAAAVTVVVLAVAASNNNKIVLWRSRLITRFDQLYYCHDSRLINAPAASYWLRRVTDDGGHRD